MGIDIDECAQAMDDCDVNANCDNVDGSFICTCKDGWTGSGITCSDIDECVEGTNNCHTNADGVNADGSFFCECQTGYTGDGVLICQDVDECEVGTHQCLLTGSKCVNTVGSYVCICPDGYVGDGINCTDIDECSIGGVKCNPANAVCVNLPGSYECQCKEGFFGDGVTCTEEGSAVTTPEPTPPAETTTPRKVTPRQTTTPVTKAPVFVTDTSGFVIVKADARENVTRDGKVVQQQTLGKIRRCLEKDGRYFGILKANVTLYPDPQGAKRDFLKVIFDLVIPPTKQEDIHKVNAEIEDILRQCFNETEKAPVLREGTVDNDPSNPGRDCLAVAVAGSEAVRSILIVLAVAMFFIIGVLAFMAYQKATAQGSYSPSAA